jgi:hypothetical protein
MRKKDSERKLKLTGYGMGNIAKSKKENDFVFIVGDTRYECPWFVADFLSPRIGRLHSIDPTLCEFVICTKDLHDQFNDFISLGDGCEILLTSTNRSFFVSVAAELENYEIYWLIDEYFDDEMKVSTFCSTFDELIGFDFAPDRVIFFIASHFNEIDKSFLTRLPISTLERILSHESLRIISEDSLYDFVNSCIEICANSICLLAYLHFEYLSCDKIHNFLSWSYEHFDLIQDNFSIWKAITVRLALSVSAPIPNWRSLPREFCPSGNYSLDGIISYLTREYGGNVHEVGIVEVSAKSHDPSLPPRNAVELQSESYFQSKDSPDQWLCYDFKNHRVKPSHYSIHAHSNNWYLRSWMLEGSNDGSSWNCLDAQNDNSTTNSNHPIGTFPIAESSEYRLIRLRKTGKAANGHDHLILFGFEIFGQLISPNPFALT